MGKTKQFSIVFSNPNGVFLAGESISGSIAIELSTPQKLRSIQVRLFGEARVRWNGKKYSSTGNSNVIYKANETYFNQNYVLWGKKGGDSVEHAAGFHHYPFTLTLRHGLPTSFAGQLGHIKYMAIATIEKSWKFDKIIHAPFTVLSTLDLNCCGSEVSAPVNLSRTVRGSTSCCASTGEISARFHMDRSGYVPGETIVISGSVDNESTKKVIGTALTFSQEVTFKGKSDSVFSGGRFHRNVLARELAVVRQPKVMPGQVAVVNEVGLEIPPLPPSHLHGCDIIDVDYKVNIHVQIKGATADIQLVTPVTIGTVPIHNVRHNPWQTLPTSSQQQRTGNPPASSPSGAAPSAPPAYDLPGPSSAEDFPIEPPPSYEECTTQQGVSFEGFDDAEEATAQAAGGDGDDNDVTDLPHRPRYVYYNWTIPAQPTEGSSDQAAALPSKPLEPADVQTNVPDGEVDDDVEDED